MAEFEALKSDADPNIPTSSGQHVLMKDQSKIKRALRRTTILVNSRDRSYTQYPNSNDFIYTFSRPISNILSIELMNGCLSGYFFNINVGWNSFTFQEVKTRYEITLTPGLYTNETLLVELISKLNAIPNKKNTYSSTLNPNTRRMTITGSAKVSFSLLFHSGSKPDQIDYNTLAILYINTPARLLGFGLKDYYSDVSGSITAPIPMDINNFINRTYLHIEADGKNLSRMETGAGRKDCFHVFYITPGEQEYYFLNKETDHSIFESSPAPISRLRSLRISLQDEFNRPMDINVRDFSLTFEITHLE